VDFFLFLKMTIWISTAVLQYLLRRGLSCGRLEGALFNTGNMKAIVTRSWRNIFVLCFAVVCAIVSSVYAAAVDACANDNRGQCDATDTFSQLNSLKVNDATVGYYKTGSGPALVLIHGFPLSGRTWRMIVPLLSQSFTCYAFDVIGFGASFSDVDFHYTPVGQATVIQNALRLLNVSTFSLIGNDSGGWISRELALLSPSSVSKVFLTNTEIPDHRPPFIPEYQLLARVPYMHVPFQYLLKLKAFRHSVAAFGPVLSNVTLVDLEFGDLFVKTLINDGERAKSAFRFLRHMDFKRVDGFKKEHGKLTMPVMFLWGDTDVFFPLNRAREMESQFPNVVFKVLPGGHLFMHEEEPFASIVAQTAHEFLTA
jgi:haloalkane dehalogenase